MKTKNINTIILVLSIGIGIIQSTGCKKFIEPDLPIDRLTSESVFSNSTSASAALSNIYYLIPGSMGNLSSTTGLASDELALRNLNDMMLYPFFTNNLSSKSSNNSWGQFYELIFRVNSILEGLESSKSISNAAKTELVGQAKFLRAFIYFYLVNLYGGVPLVKTTDYTINMMLPRSTEIEVYKFVIEDLSEAQRSVSDNYLKPDLITVTPERVTANKAGVTALLARVFLYTKQWKNAEDQATKVIDNQNYGIVESLNDVFLMNSMEAIWQIEGDISQGVNSGDGNFYIPEPPLNMLTTHITDNLKSEFTSGDLRKVHWLSSVEIGSSTFYFPFKYKKRTVPNGVTTEYNMMLRLAEQYLIRAEARAHLGDVNGAIEDLNVIRKRANVYLYTSLSEQALAAAIEKERQVELFSEWGHRWFDLKRTGMTDAALGPLKGDNWQPTDKLFPIPANEFLSNPNLRGHQNPGYTEN